MVTNMDSSIFYNVWDEYEEGYPFYIMIGGRRMGKTYSALEGLIDKKEDFIFMRRTKDQMDSITDSPKGEGLNPFQYLNKDRDWKYGFTRQTAKVSRIHWREQDEDGIWHAEGRPLGYGLSLSTIATIKGISAESCNYMVYDEFIKEPHEKPIKAEAQAFFSAYDTLCSAREIAGQKPIICFLLANSTDIYNPILQELGIVPDAEKLSLVLDGEKGKHPKGVVKKFPERGLKLCILEMSEQLRAARARSAIMRLTAGTKYNEMALNNNFSYNDMALCGHKPIKGWRPVCQIDNCWMYAKKGSPELYFCYARGSVTEHFNLELLHDQIEFKRSYGMMIADRFPKGAVYFESYELKAKILTTIIGVR